MNNSHKIVTALVSGLLVLSIIGGGVYLYAANNKKGDNNAKASTTTETKKEPTPEVKKDEVKKDDTKVAELSSKVAELQTQVSAQDATLKAAETKKIEDQKIEEQAKLLAQSIAPLVPATPAQSAVSAGSYTNPFMPGLKVNYPSGWAFNTTTAPAGKMGTATLVSRTITLTKGGTKITLSIFPLNGSPIEQPNLSFDMLKSNINGSGINRYDSATGVGDYYGRQTGRGCIKMFPIQTNIKTGLAGIPYVDSVLVAYVQGAQHVAEADQIIANSNFR
jgi:hypothetical protein